MAVKMRLRRIGAKKQPAYRVVVADARSPRDGRFIEIVGHYNPLTEPSTIHFDTEKVLYWLKTGAQPTDVVVRLLKKSGVWAVYSGDATEVIVPVAVAPTAAPAPAPVVEEVVVVVEEVPAVEEVIVVEEVPVVEEVAVVEEPAVEEVAVVEEPVVAEEVAEVATEEKPAEEAV
jgi:small subunit ribosomal protein S16